MTDRELALIRPRGQRLSNVSRREFLVGSALFGTLAVVTPSFLVACATSSSTGSTAKKGGHIVEASPVDIQMLNPILASDNIGFTIGGMIFDGLVSSDVSGNIIPLMAKALPETSSDGLSLTFHLRPNLKWTDGQPITADDVVFTFELFHSPQYKAVSTTRRAEWEQYVDSITASDPSTVVIRYKSVYAPSISSSLQRGILPKHVLGSLAPADINTAPFNWAPNVSSGAFKFVRWDKGQQVVLQRNENYYRTPAYLDQYVMKVIPDMASTVSALKTGEVDMSVGVDPSFADAIKSSSNLNLVDFWESDIVYLGFQLDPAGSGAKVVGDVAVRQAVMYGVDRAKIAKAVYGTAAVPAVSVLPALSWAYDSSVSPKYTYDPTKAKSILDAAGWTTSGGATRQKNGVPLTFEMLVPSTDAAVQSTAAAMQEQLKAIGITVTLKSEDFGSIIGVLRNTRNYQSMLISLNLSQDPDIIGLLVTSANTVVGGFNGGQYKNPSVDDQLHQAAGTFDQSKRKPLYVQAQDQLMKDLPWAPILELKDLVGLSKRVNGISGAMGPYNEYFRNFMGGVWVSDGK